ncbi:hypothetical protein CCHR01_02650 [Colletotrichum chrysophilum]|uniref:Uncharacterized protein n=1 Tax=Colletotrichum chrysophilum TaxID=1836956 RepID=A0AAD9AWM4_9PEZI|nr:hypothetical protein CCHR01_02650 [Colletotrichum chrysophilum]
MAREGKPEEPLDESEVESMDALRRRGVEELSNGAARLLLFQRVRLPSTQRPRELRRTSTAPAWPVDQLQRCSTVPCGKVPPAKGTVGSRLQVQVQVQGRMDRAGETGQGRRDRTGQERRWDGGQWTVDPNDCLTSWFVPVASSH